LIFRDSHQGFFENAEKILRCPWRRQLAIPTRCYGPASLIRCQGKEITHIGRTLRKHLVEQRSEEAGRSLVDVGGPAEEERNSDRSWALENFVCQTLAYIFWQGRFSWAWFSADPKNRILAKSHPWRESLMAEYPLAGTCWWRSDTIAAVVNLKIEQTIYRDESLVGIPITYLSATGLLTDLVGQY